MWTVINGVILVIGGLSIQTHAEVGPTSFATVLEKHSSEIVQCQYRRTVLRKSVLARSDALKA